MKPFTIIASLFVCLLSFSVAAQEDDLGNELGSEQAKRFPFTGKLDLSQNYPNPFSSNQSTTIQYRAMDVPYVSIVVCTLEGKKMFTFENLPSGAGKIVIDGSKLSAGTYLYSLIVNGRSVERRKMVVGHSL